MSCLHPQLPPHILFAASGGECPCPADCDCRTEGRRYIHALHICPKDPPWMNVSTTCPRCKKEMVLRVSQPGYERWRTGELIQNCALGLSDVDLERLLSGYCPPCWDLAFTDDVSKSAPPVDDESPF